MLTINELTHLLRALKGTIHDDYRATEEDTIPGMQVTVGASDDMEDWNYQTGDNSYSGAAYFYPNWAVIYLYRRSNCFELARDAISQLLDSADARDIS
jgi:hypothetical protein